MLLMDLERLRSAYLELSISMPGTCACFVLNKDRPFRVLINGKIKAKSCVLRQ